MSDVSAKLALAQSNMAQSKDMRARIEHRRAFLAPGMSELVWIQIHALEAAASALIASAKEDIAEKNGVEA